MHCHALPPLYDAMLCCAVRGLIASLSAALYSSVLRCTSVRRSFSPWMTPLCTRCGQQQGARMHSHANAVQVPYCSDCSSLAVCTSWRQKQNCRYVFLLCCAVVLLCGGIDM
jgi:hypothetical protein